MRHHLRSLLLACLVGCPHPAPAPAVTSDGARIHFEVFGDGPPVLVINGGFGQDSSGYDSLARLLQDTHQVVLYDRRGTGRSVMPRVDAETITFDGMVEDIEAIRRRLGHERWSLLGHSFGGMLAAYYATQHPKRVDRLILSSSPGLDQALFEMDSRGLIQARLSEEDRVALRAIEADYEAGRATPDDLTRFTEILSRAYVADDRHTPWVVRRKQHQHDDVGRLVTEDMKRIDFDCKPGLARFARPVLVLHGDTDIFPLSISERTRDAIPAARLVVLEETGHYGWVEHPATYRDHVVRFLAE